MKFDNVKKIYDRLLAIETADPTLVIACILFFDKFYSLISENISLISNFNILCHTLYTEKISIFDPKWHVMILTLIFWKKVLMMEIHKSYTF